VSTDLFLIFQAVDDDLAHELQILKNWRSTFLNISNIDQTNAVAADSTEKSIVIVVLNEDGEKLDQNPDDKVSVFPGSGLG
jgi:ethanolamine utilization microcompartment shell protein EutL